MKTKKRKKVKKILNLVLIIISCASVGLATIVTASIFEGSSFAKGNKWDVYFQSIESQKGTITDWAEITGKTSVTFGGQVDSDFSFYEIILKVVNKGTIDAMVDNVVKPGFTENVDSVLDFKVRYASSGEELKHADLLKAGESQLISIYIKFKDGVTEEQVNQAWLQDNISVDVTYTQADETAKEVYTTIQNLIQKANPISVTNYDLGDTTEMYTFTHKNDTIIDYRYIGYEPNNYIDFNNETWRIIGVFDNKLKIVRNIDKLFSFDDKRKCGTSTDVFGSNDWRDAQLMYFLNPTSYSLLDGYSLDGNYIRDNKNNIIYELGKLPATISPGATSYSGSSYSWKIKDTYLKYVSDEKYYLGPINREDLWSDQKLNPDNLYDQERATENIWIGKVGLMYPSDCLYIDAYNAEEYYFEDQYSGSLRGWLSGTATYLISPILNSNYYISKYKGNNDLERTIDSTPVHSLEDLSPVVYLKSDIHLVGTGSSDNHYKISQ